MRLPSISTNLPLTVEFAVVTVNVSVEASVAVKVPCVVESFGLESMTKVNEAVPVVDATTNAPLYDDGVAPDIVKVSPVERPWSLEVAAVTVPLDAASEDRATLEANRTICGLPEYCQSADPVQGGLTITSQSPALPSSENAPEESDVSWAKPLPSIDQA